MIRQYLNVTVTGSPSDVHVRTCSTFWCDFIASNPGDPTNDAPCSDHHRCHHCGAAFRAHGPAAVAFCGVYVRPVGPVPGYWYFPEGDQARTLLASLPVQS